MRGRGRAGGTWWWGSCAGGLCGGGGMCGRAGGACVVWGVCVWWGACMAGGACVGGMHGRGYVWQGVHGRGGMHATHTPLADTTATAYGQ